LYSITCNYNESFFNELKLFLFVSLSKDKY
jgi:hypothetical protein